MLQEWQVHLEAVLECMGPVEDLDVRGPHPRDCLLVERHVAERRPEEVGAGQREAADGDAVTPAHVPGDPASVGAAAWTLIDFPVDEVLAGWMTGVLAAGLFLQLVFGLLLARWWQALLVNPGGLRKDFYALRLNQVLSLVGIAMVGLAALKFGVLSSLALQWSLIAMVPFLLVGLAVVHASLANLKASRGWLIALYILMSLLPQVLLMVILVGVLDPWLELRRRTSRAETN